MELDRVTIGLVCTRGVGPERGGRVNNEDNYLVCRGNELRYRSGENEVVEYTPTYGVLLAVADGMGGHEDGDLASTAAVRALSRLFRKGAPRDPELELHRFMLDAHKRLYRKVAELGPVKMGTTLTCCWVVSGRAYWCHVGDSRLYLWRDGQIKRITRDHTRAEFAHRDGRSIDPENAGYLTQNFVYGSRGFGDDQNIRIDAGTDTGSFELKARDRIILCSDGLSGPVEDHRIAEVVRETPEPQSTATSLMERSLASGSDDNVTVIVARVDKPAAQQRFARVQFEGNDGYDLFGAEDHQLPGAGDAWDNLRPQGLLPPPPDTDPGF